MWENICENLIEKITTIDGAMMNTEDNSNARIVVVLRGKGLEETKTGWISHCKKRVLVSQLCHTLHYDKCTKT